MYLARYVIIKLLLFLFLILLSACSNVGNQSLYPDLTVTELSLRQTKYEELLLNYMMLSDNIFFLLYDFHGDEIPELIIVGEHEGNLIDAVYTIKNDNIFSLEYDSEVDIVNFALSARAGISAVPNNGHGLMTYSISPSAGAFGTSAYYTLITVDGNRLIIDSQGSIYVDIAALHEIFDDFGRNADSVELNNAIQEHTYFILNNEHVSEHDFRNIFNIEERLSPYRVTETNIQEILRTH